jgi:glycogen(starch) synthase
MVREVVQSFELPVEGAPGAQRRRPGRWGAATAAPATARATGRRLGPHPVREGLPGARSGDRRAAPAGARHPLRHRRRGSYLPELQTQIDMEGVSDIVQLAGFVPDDELHAMLQRAGCVIIPSLYEPFGIVALEGMAAGAPTVVARTGGLAEIVEGTDAGMLFEPGNHHELAHRIERGAGRPPAAAEHLRANAARLLRRSYTWDAIAVETVPGYAAALA